MRCVVKNFFRGRRDKIYNDKIPGALGAHLNIVLRTIVNLFLLL